MEIKKEIYITISALLLSALFLILFFVYPIFTEIKQKSQELVLEKNNRLALEDQFTEAKKFKQKYEEYRLNLEKIDDLFVDSGNPVPFIEFLEKTASEPGLKMQISTPSFSKESAPAFANFHLSCSGSFSGILNFVNELESGPYLIRVQSLNMRSRTAAEQKKEGGALGAEISIKVFAK